MAPKFYAVRAGYKPGIYHSWDDCLAQVKGFKSATFKSFTTLTEAENFLASSAPSRSKAKAKPKTQKFYGVRSGHVPGIYTDWETAEAQIKGWKAPRYKAFSTYAQAEAFVQGSDDGSPLPAQPQTPLSASSSSSSSSSSSKPTQPLSSSSDVNPPSAKRRKTDRTTQTSEKATDPLSDDYEPGEGPLPPGASDGFDPRITFNPTSGKVEYKTQRHLNAQRWEATKPTATTPLKIYTDGSSLGNGAAGAVAGIGVYFGPSHPSNTSAPLPGTRQTNQRAELAAIARALELSPRNRALQIYTDSNYAIKCVTEWFIRWRANGWVNSQKKAVENRDLIEKVLGLLEERARARGPTSKVEFIWVKGHASDEGNTAADELAVAGAREAKARIARGEVIDEGDEGQMKSIEGAEGL